MYRMSFLSFDCIGYVSYMFHFCGYVLQVQRKIDLVYGGGSVGLMGLISQTVYDGGCHVLGYD